MIDPTSQQPNAAPEPPPLPAPSPVAAGPNTPVIPGPRGALGLLSAVRARQRRQLWMQGGITAGALTLLLVLLAGIAGASSVTAARVLLALVPVALAAPLGWFGILRARKVVGDDSRTARLVGARVPEVALDLLGAVELRRELAEATGEQFSRELANAFLEREDAVADRLTPGRIVDPAVTRRWLRAGVAAGIALLAGFFFARGTWFDGLRLALRTEASSTGPRSREPITGDIELTYRYPAYTGLQPRTIAGTSGEIAAPAGTEVVLKTRSDREVARADIEVNGKALPLQVEGARDLQGSFVVDRPGTYAFVFYGKRGRELARGPDTAIAVEVDQAPKVNIRTPGDQLEIDPGQKVTLDYDATDDYGVSSLELVYRLPAKSEETRVALPHGEGRRVKDTYGWNLGGIAANPGDHIQYRIEAKDNDAVTGPKLGASRTKVLIIYSPAAHRRAALEKAEQLWNRLVTLLGDRLEGPDRDDPRDAARVEAHAQVDQAGFMLVGDLRAAASEISRERDAPEEIVTALINVSERLRQRLLSTSDARRTYLRYHALQVPDKDAGRRLGRVAEAEITGTEKDVLYLEALIDRQKLEELRELAKQLASERRELAGLMQQYKQTQDPNLREDILQQIQQLRTRMMELMQKMQELSRGIRDEHLNAEALQQMIKEQSMGDSLNEIEKLMREGKTDEALKKLQEMSMQLDKMMNDLEQGADDFGQDEYSELRQKMQQFQQDVEKVRKDEQKLADDTKQIRDRYRDEMRDRLKERGAQLKKELLKESEALLREYNRVEGGELPGDAERPLEDVQEQLKNLKNALEVDDFDLAAEAGAQASHSATELAQQGEKQRRVDEMFDRPQQMREASKQLSEDLARDARRADEIREKLEQLFPPPSSMMSDEDKQQLRQLNQEQRGLQKKSQELRQKMDEIQQEAPVFGQDGTEKMNGISERMGEAADRLDGKDPRRGYAEQKGALDQLDAFLKQMQDQGKGGKGKGMPMPMFGGGAGGRGSGMGPQNERVEIPDENQFQAPKEFRKDLLDAMKEGTPDKYKEQVKRYYEELVK